MTQDKSRRFSKASLFFLLWLLIIPIMVLSSCGGENQITPTPFTTTITTTPCPTKISRINYQTDYSPILVYILVEGTETYRDSITRTFQITGESLKSEVEPGDRVIMSFMEDADRDKARILDEEVVYVDFPQYAYSPLIQPTLPTNVALSTAEGSFKNFIQTTAVKATDEAYNALLTKTANEHYCAQIEEETTNKDYYQEWNKNRQESIDQFIKNYNQITTNVDLKELPDTTHTIRALAQASDLFEYYCNMSNFKRCYLLVFSNLTSIITNSPDIDQVNLNGVEVLIPLQECTFLADCSETVEKWTAYFKAAGASSVTFISKGDETEFINNEIER